MQPNRFLANFHEADDATVPDSQPDSSTGTQLLRGRNYTAPLAPKDAEAFRHLEYDAGNAPRRMSLGTLTPDTIKKIKFQIKKIKDVDANDKVEIIESIKLMLGRNFWFNREQIRDVIKALQWYKDRFNREKIYKDLYDIIKDYDDQVFSTVGEMTYGELVELEKAIKAGDGDKVKSIVVNSKWSDSEQIQNMMDLAKKILDSSANPFDVPQQERSALRSHRSIFKEIYKVLEDHSVKSAFRAKNSMDRTQVKLSKVITKIAELGQEGSKIKKNKKGELITGEESPTLFPGEIPESDREESESTRLKRQHDVKTRVKKVPGTKTLSSAYGKNATITGWIIPDVRVLVAACRGGNVQVVKDLLEAGANPNEEYSLDSGAFTGEPLAVASRNGHADVVHVLLHNEHNPADPTILDKQTEHILQKLDLTSGKKDPHSVSTAKSSFYPLSPLIEAVVEGHLNVLKVLYGKGASKQPDIHVANDAALMLAVNLDSNEHPDKERIVDFLLRHGISAKTNDGAAIKIAVQEGDFDTWRVLVNNLPIRSNKNIHQKALEDAIEFLRHPNDVYLKMIYLYLTSGALDVDKLVTDKISKSVTDSDTGKPILLRNLILRKISNVQKSANLHKRTGNIAKHVLLSPLVQKIEDLVNIDKKKD